jgi:hypothetical protein
MKWERIGKISYQFVLILIEWGFKLCAIVAAGMALSSKGSFGTKLSAGFGSLSYGLRQLVEAPAEFNEISWAARKYREIGHAEFQESYGMAPIDQLVSSLNSFFVFVYQISSNLSQSPFVSIIAAVLVFISFYFLSRIIRFTRQKGQGSLLYRFEQRLGDQIFNSQGSVAKKGIRNGTGRDSVAVNKQQSSTKLT